MPFVDGDRGTPTAGGDRALVAAYGHMFQNLDIENEVLGRSGMTILDANTLGDDQLTELPVRGILLGAFKKLDRDRVRRLSQCKGIVRYGIGVDNVDLRAAQEAGIIVSNVPDYCVEEVAVHALACALSLMRELGHWDRTVRSGRWRGANPPVMRRPSTCCLGIVGFGQIGRLLETRARHLFGRIIIFDPWYKGGAEVGSQTAFAASLDELLPESDVVSVHVPLTPDTTNLLDRARLESMKPTAFVINASRGGIVDEAALLVAVRERRLAGAALDTFNTEPLRDDDELVREMRILLTPHVAWKSEEAEVELRRSAAEEIVRIVSGGTPRSRIVA